MINGGACYPATMQNLNTPHPVPVPQLYQRELPDSQESFVSAASSTFSAPQLPSSSSNLSASTVAETEFTSPPSSNVPSQRVNRALPQSPTRVRGQDAQLRIDAVNAPRTGDTAASPMSVDSPVTQGFKRTADGSVKGPGLTVDSSGGTTMGHKRNKSMELGSGTRIGELSAQLKTRLSYAMVKVQNGWEKQSLEELEEHTSQRGSPISATGRSDGSRPVFDSPTAADRRRRPSGVSENSDQMMLSPGQSTPSDPSRSLATTPSSYWRPGAKPAMHAAVNLITVTGSDAGPMLGPAADIGSRRKRRSSASHAPPPLLGSTQRKHYSDLGATPRTPATPRAGILRMPSQQAEKDAVDTLLFMSSPNNSTRLPHTSMDAQTPRSNIQAPARRVMFEAQPINEKAVNSQRHMQAPNSQQASYYRADPKR